MAILTTTHLGVRAKGGFGPQADQEISEATLDALRGDQFLVPTSQSLIGGCGDERVDLDGNRLLVPSVFGGWACAVLSDALSTRLWYRKGMTFQEHALAMAEAVRPLAPEAFLCVHTDEHSLEAAECGCAAIAKAPVVLGLLAEYSDLIDADHRDAIMANVRELLDGNYFQPGTTKLVDALEAQGVKKEVLAGAHDGLAVMRNREPGTVYDRPAFYRWCAENGLPALPFFEYDEWALRHTAKLLIPTDDSNYFFAAGDAFNSVVPFAICNPQTLSLQRG